MYDILYAKAAARFLRKLPKETRKRILSVLERARIRPEVHFERLVGEKAYKLRVGEYRIIAEVRKSELRILVIKIGHRRNIYK